MSQRQLGYLKTSHSGPQGFPKTLGSISRAFWVPSWRHWGVSQRQLLSVKTCLLSLPDRELLYTDLTV